jgi:hypothetical protein
MTTSLWRVLALGIAGAMVGATPSSAAPILSSTTAVKAAASDNVVDVRWRRGGGGIAAGVAFGALAGAAIAPRYYYGGYGYPYGAYRSYAYPAYSYSYPAYAYPAYSYSYPAYGYPAYGAYANGPVYYGAGYGSYAYPGQICGVYGGYGRWDYSQC